MYSLKEVRFWAIIYQRLPVHMFYIRLVKDFHCVVILLYRTKSWLLQN